MVHACGGLLRSLKVQEVCSVEERRGGEILGRGGQRRGKEKRKKVTEKLRMVGGGGGRDLKREAVRGKNG